MAIEVAPLSESVAAKERRLLAWLKARVRVVVAYSGGVDSAYLAWAAKRALGSGALGLTARSASLSERELDAACALAKDLELRHHVIDTDELARPEYVENAPSRCYFCKDTLLDAAAALAAYAEQGAVVVDGFNADDLSDFRPGHRAAAEHGVAHPLAEVGLSKAEIRALSRQAGLPTWNKPQLACLSSRLPYGMAVTVERLARVEAVEEGLRSLGLFDVRARLVRENEDMVRIELGLEDLARALEHRTDIVAASRQAGFRFVTLDLEPFRSGRMNEGLVQLERGQRSAVSNP